MKESNPKRLDNVLDALTEARNSLENWHDKRTKALIEIDSFSFDVRLIFEERNQILEEYKKAQEAFRAREQKLANEIGSLNEDVNELKLIQENLQKDLEKSYSQIADANSETLNAKAAAEAEILSTKTNAQTEIASVKSNAEAQILSIQAAAKAQMEKQLYIQMQAEEKAKANLVKQKADLEVIHLQARKNDATRIMNLTEELKRITDSRDRLESRARLAEHELQVLKSQMHKALGGPTLNFSAGATALFGDAPVIPKAKAPVIPEPTFNLPLILEPIALEIPPKIAIETPVAVAIKPVETKPVETPAPAKPAAYFETAAASANAPAGATSIDTAAIANAATPAATDQPQRETMQDYLKRLGY